MKKGINIYSFEKGTAIIDCMKLAKAAGFDGIELSLDEAGEINLNSSLQEISALKRKAEEIGMELISINSGLYWTYSFTSSRPEQREKAFEIGKKQIEVAAWLGMDTVAIIPGTVGVDFIPDFEVVPYDIAYDYALDAFSRLAVVAQQYGIHIGLKNVWNKFLLSPLEFRDFIDKVNSDYVGAYFDVGNVVASGYPEHWISILNRRIRKVHFKDYRRQANGLPGFVDLLAGDVNYPVVMEHLRGIGYDGYVTAEIAPYAHYSEQVIYNTSKSMDAILAK
ncbi:sugar phosphate isomerase/epimerase family protein [Paenibacillus eucommiae]|uniref:Hexulose-6-phosphate isomerase n=1 Tax=Paenibacillus eucommiae TaxID=1355755 RepID=A0ABS4IQJ4_9BACL|nr:sugar phosphate isomerase/epimerase family protein [Paenibacillus eucommiae]MBP1989829.1 hexulose-6-phosphate isomerase [Paenibacillus eucommiae]